MVAAAVCSRCPAPASKGGYCGSCMRAMRKESRLKRARVCVLCRLPKDQRTYREGHDACGVCLRRTRHRIWLTRERLRLQRDAAERAMRRHLRRQHCECSCPRPETCDSDRHRPCDSCKWLDGPGGIDRRVMSAMYFLGGAVDTYELAEHAGIDVRWVLRSIGILIRSGRLREVEPHGFPYSGGVEPKQYIIGRGVRTPPQGGMSKLKAKVYGATTDWVGKPKHDTMHPRVRCESCRTLVLGIEREMRGHLNRAHPEKLAGLEAAGAIARTQWGS